MPAITQNVYAPDLIKVNKDSCNDCFTVRSKGKLELRIYNRWGHVVYFNENYKNDWRLGELDEGIYFYQVSNEDMASCKGWIQVRNDTN